jgi:hypothetical protein
MARWTFAGCVALAALGAAAVLDVGSNSAQAAPSVSSFAGNWSGTWSIAERGVAGFYEWTISDSGRIEGTVHNATWDVAGDVVGRVHDDGTIGFVGFAPNDVPGAGFSGFAFKGTAEIVGDDTLVVSAIGLGESQEGRPSLVAVLERE